MITESMLSKRPVLGIAAPLLFLLKLFSSHNYCTAFRGLLEAILRNTIAAFNLDCDKNLRMIQSKKLRNFFGICLESGLFFKFVNGSFILWHLANLL